MHFGAYHRFGIIIDPLGIVYPMEAQAMLAHRRVLVGIGSCLLYLDTHHPG